MFRGSSGVALFFTAFRSGNASQGEGKNCRWEGRGRRASRSAGSSRRLDPGFGARAEKGGGERNGEERKGGGAVFILLYKNSLRTHGKGEREKKKKGAC